MIIVTGGAGFIGSNIVAQLNAKGVTDILIVDHLKNGKKMLNVADLDICDYMDRDDFLTKIENGHNFGDVEAVFHEGACSATTEWDGQYVMRYNYEYSKTLLGWCQRLGIQFLYASSAAVYGNATSGFSEGRINELPTNLYGYSKFLFDQHVRRLEEQLTSQVVGFRYFNVYGPREQHKGSMSSTAFHFNSQVLTNGRCKLFCGSDGYDDGEQQRDFVFVGDCANINLWFLDNPDQRGIFNVGVGQARSFNDMARAVVDWHGQGEIEYVPFPDHLKGYYQNYTQANINSLRAAGYKDPMTVLESGVKQYLNWLNSSATQ